MSDRECISMFASIDMTCERIRRKSNQFDFPSSKGETGATDRYQQRSSHRRSPILAVSADFYNSLTNRPEDSVEQSMKPIEMLALIRGTTPEEASKHELALPSQRHRSFLGSEDDGQTSTEGSSIFRQPTSDEFELEFDDDYLLGDSFIGFTEDGNYSSDELPAFCPNASTHRSGSPTAVEKEDGFDSESEEEIFDFDL